MTGFRPRLANVTTSIGVAVVSVPDAFLSVVVVVVVVAAAVVVVVTVVAAAAAAAEDIETFGSDVAMSVYFADIGPIPSSGSVRDLDDLVCCLALYRLFVAC